MKISSIEAVAANSYGVSGFIDNFNEERQNAMVSSIKAIAEDISVVADGFFGHVKTVISSPSGWMGFNLVDTRLGVDVSGSMVYGRCEFKAMAVALDIDLATLKDIIHSKIQTIEGLTIKESIQNLIMLDGSV